MNLVLCTARDTMPRRLRYFRSEARQLARQWGANTDVVDVLHGGHIATAIAAVDEPIERLAIVSHGYTDRVVARWRGVRVGRHVPPRVVSLEYLCEVLAPRVEPDVHVALACCWTAANPRPWPRYRSQYGPGGAQSFAAKLYRGIAPSAPECCVIGHPGRGPTTEKPHLRAWGGRYGVESDGRGVSVLDFYLGPDAHFDGTARASWRRACEETDADGHTGAELLLGGNVPAWLQ